MIDLTAAEQEIAAMVVFTSPEKPNGLTRDEFNVWLSSKGYTRQQADNAMLKAWLAGMESGVFTAQMN